MEDQQIYLAPNIRNQLLEDWQEFIDKKRVERLVLLSKHQETLLNKAKIAEGRQQEKLNKQANTVINAANKLEEHIAKFTEKVEKFAELNNELINIENVIKQAEE